MTRTIQTILATAAVALLLVVAVAARGAVNTQTWSALDARNAALIEANRYVQQLEAQINTFEAKEAALIEGNRYVQQLEAQINTFDANEAALIEGNRYVQQLEAQIKAYREKQR